MKRKYRSGTNTSKAVSPSKRRRRQSHVDQIPSNEPTITKKSTNLPYPHGNFQIDQWPTEARLSYFRKEWFENRDILDIGCNAGFMTLAIALVFRPSTVIGVDIDRNLIDVAKKNLSMCQQMVQEQKLRLCKVNSGRGDKQRSIIDQCIFPVSMIRMYGPVSAPSLNPVSSSSSLGYCRSITFKCENFVLESDEQLEKEKPQYDTIIALSVTKWIHLNYGDDGIKRFFKRVYTQLRTGGYFVLDAQPWNLYKRDLKNLQATSQSELKLDLKPNMFKEYLLSDEVGFTACRVAASDDNPAEGWRRTLLLLEKGQA